MVIFLTGVGTRALARVVETVYPAGAIGRGALSNCHCARGPKPVAALKEPGVPVTIAVPEPTPGATCSRALDARRDVAALKGRRVAVPGIRPPNAELLAGFAERGAQVTRVPVDQGALPEEPGRCGPRWKPSCAARSISLYSRLLFR